MTTEPFGAYSGISKEQLDVIERFEADYNAVEKYLHEALDSDQHVPFTQLINKYSRKHVGWRDADLLRRIAKVRNAIVHGKTEPYCYIAVPMPALAEDLRGCRERLTNPARVIPTFQRKVETISPHDNLAHVLKIITQREYSQFPVYEADRFQGLLTENGITRWLAQQVSTELSLVELEKVPVKQVLQNEEKRQNYNFVEPHLPVDDVKSRFSSQELLEAVLITAKGRESETLLGIATRWDIIHLV